MGMLMQAWALDLDACYKHDDPVSALSLLLSHGNTVAGKSMSDLHLLACLLSKESCYIVVWPCLQNADIHVSVLLSPDHRK